MIESEPVQKFWPVLIGVCVTWTVVLVDGADPYELEAVTEYDVFVDGAVTLIEHPVELLLQAHEDTGLPLPQVAVSVTLVPALTGFGDWPMLQLLGADPVLGGVILPVQLSVVVGAS